MDSPPDSTSYKLPLNIFKIVACPVRQKISAKTGLPSTPNSITIFGKVETLYHIQKFIDQDKDGFLPKIFPKILNVYRAHNEQIIVVANKIDEKDDLISADEARNLSIEKKLKILRFFQYLHKQNICIASGRFESWFLNWITNFGLLTHDVFCTEQMIENSTESVSDSLPPAPESSAYNSLDLANVPPVKALKSLDVYYVCHYLGLENEFELSNPLNRPRIDQVINFLTDILVKEKSLNFNKNIHSKSTNSDHLLIPNRTPNAINLTKSNMHLPLQSDFSMSDKNKNSTTSRSSTSSVISNISQKKLFQIWLKKQNGLGNLLLNLKLSKPTPGVISVARAAKIKKINKNHQPFKNSEIRATKIYQAAITCEFPIDEVTARFEYSSQENSPLEEKHLSWGSIKMQKQNNEFYNDYSDLLLFSHLCKSYPITKPRLLAELYRRENSIPDIYRAEIWKCLLDIERVDRTENTIDLCDLSEATSRQLDVDIPRCHQYNNTLASTEGQSFIKRVLTKWILSNKDDLAYWQGLDSLCAPFCILYIDNEDLGLGCGK